MLSRKVSGRAAIAGSPVSGLTYMPCFSADLTTLHACPKSLGYTANLARRLLGFCNCAAALTGICAHCRMSGSSHAPWRESATSPASLICSCKCCLSDFVWWLLVVALQKWSMCHDSAWYRSAWKHFSSCKHQWIHSLSWKLGQIQSGAAVSDFLLFGDSIGGYLGRNVKKIGLYDRLVITITQIATDKPQVNGNLAHCMWHTSHVDGSGIWVYIWYI